MYCVKTAFSRKLSRADGKLAKISRHSSDCPAARGSLPVKMLCNCLPANSGGNDQFRIAPDADPMAVPPCPSSTCNSAAEPLL